MVELGRRVGWVAGELARVREENKGEGGLLRVRLKKLDQAGVGVAGEYSWLLGEEVLTMVCKEEEVMGDSEGGGGVMETEGGSGLALGSSPSTTMLVFPLQTS